MSEVFDRAILDGTNSKIARNDIMFALSMSTKNVFAANLVQPITEDLSGAKYLLAALAKVPMEYARFMALGNEITSVTSKTMISSAEFTIENRKCNYGPEGQGCKKAATLKIYVFGQFTKAELLQE